MSVLFEKVSHFGRSFQWQALVRDLLSTLLQTFMDPEMKLVFSSDQSGGRGYKTSSKIDLALFLWQLSGFHVKNILAHMFRMILQQKNGLKCFRNIFMAIFIYKINAQESGLLLLLCDSYLWTTGRGRRSQAIQLGPAGQNPEKNPILQEIGLQDLLKIII